MRNGRSLGALGLVCLIVAVCISPATGQENAAPDDQVAAPGGGGPAVVLDDTSVWRMFHVLKPPEIAFDDGVKPAVFEQYWLRKESAPPPAEWTRPEFDDSEWLRGPAAMGCKTPFVARACFRGRFNVADPARVQKLTLTVSYHGGVVVRVNGQELRRADVGAGPEPGLATPYPPEAFVGPDGVLLARERSTVVSGGKAAQPGKPGDEAVGRMALRKRTLADVEIPAGLLRKGLNVLAVEVVRAPYHKVVDELKTGDAAKPVYDMRWNTCELLDLRLIAAGADGLEPNASRPKGFQVWNGTTLRGDFDLDFGDLCEPLRPIAITGVPNGTFSGKVVVGSAKPIKGLRASLTELRGPGGTIGRSELRVRYGALGGAEYGAYEYMYGLGSSDVRYPARAAGLEVLQDAAPAEVPVRSTPAKRADGVEAGFGAVVPVWVTVRVPAAARPGVYEGTLTVEAEGEEPVALPVRLDVLGWTLPDPEGFGTWIELIQSPDTLELEYEVEPWSDRHFELIARSMRLIREVGSGVLYVPLICQTNYGNAESMVRWVRKGENEYDFDFSVVDRYLDVAEKDLGRPKIVCFIVWDVYLIPKGNEHQVGRGIDRVKDRMAELTVTLLDPAAGALSHLAFPNYDGDPAARAHWQKLFDGLRARLKKRGLEQTMMVGWSSDVKPRKEEVAFWGEVSGNLPWVSHSHVAPGPLGGRGIFGFGTHFKTGYMTSIYSLVFADDPAKGRLYGWKNPVLHAQNIRFPALDKMPGTFVRSMGEINIAGGQRGFGRLGGDCWPAVRDKNGRRVSRAWERYPQSNWSNLNLRCSFLLPGPEGAMASTRFEVLREGVQECEARIFIERSLTDDSLRRRLGEDLARRCEELLDERALCVQRGVANFNVSGGRLGQPWVWTWQEGVAGHAWFQSSGWGERGARLYALAGEVERKVAAK